MLKYRYRDENRTDDQILEHYKIETELAEKLRTASKEERKILYTKLYNEMFQRIPHHPQVLRKDDKEYQKLLVNRQMNFLKRFISQNINILEIGPGDCSLAIEISKSVKKIYGVDVSDEITKNKNYPENFQLILSDGSNIPLENESIDIAYSHQLMEHLHPDDAEEQLNEIFKSLKPDGIYICITPNKISGPHDISRYFDDEAKGFHLKEYTFSELLNMFKLIGFRKIKGYMGGRGRYIRIPIFIIKLTEKVLGIFKIKTRRKFANWLPIKAILGITIIGVK